MKLGPKQTKWLEALRSGEYKQATGCLWDTRDGENFYCCLGVANCVLGLGETDKEVLQNTFLKLGLRSSCGDSRDAGLNLTGLNDQGYSFSWIADIIESSPERFFQHSV